MKKRVLLYLVMIVSLAAIAYSAAVTNPGHGVEEIGSGSSPYAAFRDWNVLEAGYEDQYSGPVGLKSNVFWLGTLNAETIAAQNSSGDWCAIQVHPSGIYMNCFNNASNMTLFNSYYWNGTNFTKNDTIKNGTATIEKKVLNIGAGGGEEDFFIYNPGADFVGTHMESTSASVDGYMRAEDGPAGSGATIEVLLDGNDGKAIMIGENSDGVTITSVEVEGGLGTTTTTATDGAETGTTEVGPGTVTTTGTDGAGTGNTGGEIIVTDGIDLSVSGAGISDLFNMVLSATPAGGQSETTILDSAGLITLVEQSFSTSVLGGTFDLAIYDVATGTNIVGISGNPDANSNGIFSLTTSETTTGLGATNSLGMQFDVVGNGITSWTTQDNTATDTTSIEQDASADTITITTGDTLDESGFKYTVEIDQYLEVLDGGGGFAVAIPAGTSMCMLAGVYLNAGSCYLHDFDIGLSFPGVISGNCRDTVTGLGCACTAGFYCIGTT